MKKKRYILIFSFVFQLFLFHSVVSAAVMVTLHTAGPVSSRSMQQVTMAIHMTSSYMQQHFHLDFRDNIDLTVASSKQTFRQLNADRHITGNISGGSTYRHITVYIPIGASQAYTTGLVAHELAHQYQFLIVPPNLLAKNMWFGEGMADLLAAHITASLQTTRMNQFQQNAWNKTQADELSLSEITTQTGWSKYFGAGRPTYAKADLAVLYLEQSYGEKKLFEYIRRLRNQDANEAMQAAYGISINELEQRLKKYESIKWADK